MATRKTRAKRGHPHARGDNAQPTYTKTNKKQPKGTRTNEHVERHRTRIRTRASHTIHHQRRRPARRHPLQTLPRPLREKRQRPHHHAQRRTPHHHHARRRQHGRGQCQHGRRRTRSRHARTRRPTHHRACTPPRQHQPRGHHHGRIAHPLLPGRNTTRNHPHSICGHRHRHLRHHTRQEQAVRHHPRSTHPEADRRVGQARTASARQHAGRRNHHRRDGRRIHLRITRQR